MGADQLLLDEFAGGDLTRVEGGEVTVARRVVVARVEHHLAHPGKWRRLLRISLDGLSSRNTEPLPQPDMDTIALATDRAFSETRQTRQRPR